MGLSVPRDNEWEQLADSRLVRPYLNVLGWSVGW